MHPSEEFSAATLLVEVTWKFSMKLFAYIENLKCKAELQFPVKCYDLFHHSLSHIQICVIWINFMLSFARTICCRWYLKRIAKKLHAVNSLVSFDDFLPFYLHISQSLSFFRQKQYNITILYEQREDKPWQLSIFFPTSLPPTKFND